VAKLFTYLQNIAMKKQPPTRKQVDSSASTSEYSQLQLHNRGAKAQPHFHKPLSQTEIENQEFQQHKFEATKLQIQAKYGTLTPEGQEQLTILQAKMNGILQKREENASLYGHNFANIAVNRPDATPDTTSVQMQPTTGSTSEQASAQNEAEAPKEQFKRDYPLVKELVTNIDETLPPDKILEELFKNFEKINFKYTMVNKSHETLLKGTREGDCQTLARAFQAVASEYFGIKDITIEQIKEPFLSEAEKTPHKGSGGKESNCDFEDGKKGWFFQNHYWAVWNNKIYDVLFLSHKPTEADKAKQKNPLKSMFMPEGEYYETEKGRVVYPVRDRYSTVELSVFDKAKNFINNMSNRVAADATKVISSIRSFFIGGRRNDSGLDSILAEWQNQNPSE
jgi:hypothetical protein